MRSSSASRTPVPSPRSVLPGALGDYMSGSNHVLPTGGTARFAAGLGVHTFMKPVEVIEYDEEGLKALAARINAFAVSEDLPAHGECVLSASSRIRTIKETCANRRRKPVCDELDSCKPAAAQRSDRRGAVRRSAAGRAGVPERQREPVCAGSGRMRHHRQACA